MAMLKYNEKFPAIAEDLAANGESDEYIAFRLQISMPTFYNYKAQFPEFAEALVVGRKVCYSRVRAKLLKLAQGRCTVITEVFKDGELHKTTERQLPPNLKAIIYFQKHMRVGGRLSGELCWPHGHKTENTLPQDDSKMSNGRLSGEFCLRQDGQMPDESAQPQADSNGRLSGELCWPHGGRLSGELCWPHGQKTENTQPQDDSKMSNAEENPTDQLAVRLVPQSGDPMAPTAESAQPQTDSNGRLSGELCWPHGGRLSGDLCWPHGQDNPAQTDSKMLAVRLVPQSGDPTRPAAPTAPVGAGFPGSE